jgi:excisionase family DNA binding protein
MESYKQTIEDDHFEPQMGRSVSIEQAARLLNVSRRTVYNRIRDGKLQTIRTLGGSQRVLMSSLDEIRRPAMRDPERPGLSRDDPSTETTRQ